MKKFYSVWLPAVINLAVCEMAIYGAAHACYEHGADVFRYYTVDSNLLGAVACGLYAVLLIRFGLSGKPIPRWAEILRYVGVCCVLLTFIVVVTILAPLSGPGSYVHMLLEGNMLYLHLLCPVLAAVSYFLHGRPGRPAWKLSLIALIPTMLYAAVSSSMNFLGFWDGPYPFLKVYEQPWWGSVVWFVVIVGGAWLIAFVVALIKGRSQDSSEKVGVADELPHRV